MKLAGYILLAVAVVALTRCSSIKVNKAKSSAQVKEGNPLYI